MAKQTAEWVARGPGRGLAEILRENRFGQAFLASGLHEYLERQFDIRRLLFNIDGVPRELRMLYSLEQWGYDMLKDVKMQDTINPRFIHEQFQQEAAIALQRHFVHKKQPYRGWERAIQAGDGYCYVEAIHKDQDYPSITAAFYRGNSLRALTDQGVRFLTFAAPTSVTVRRWNGEERELNISLRLDNEKNFIIRIAADQDYPFIGQKSKAGKQCSFEATYDVKTGKRIMDPAKK